MMDYEIVYPAVSMVAAGLVAFGIVKGKLYNFVTHDQHRDMCSKERDETNRVVDKLFKAQSETRDMVAQIHGYMKAQNGGTL